jgi:ATP-dependent RNA helicase DHX57
MGKAKKTLPEIKKCICNDPYSCSCGNRPERPSRGHKWDPDSQTWGGKGHKQKGASGQVASIAQAATVTSVGKTCLEQWQRLPTQLLLEYCKKQKRAAPVYQLVARSSFRYQCILPDGKNPEKDLIFVPASSVKNEEQAQEEAAMLALLELTPTLPHERKLPEPYRTTWILAQKNAAGATAAPAIETVATSSSTQGVAAQASTLVSGSAFRSKAEQRQQLEAQRRERNAKIRRHEAIRQANAPPPVFMSAALRQQIERLLRGDVNATLFLTDKDDEDEGADEAAWTSFGSDVEEYVLERLHGEGFTRKQAHASYQHLIAQNLSYNINDEDNWEKAYEGCLQWLLVHLDEAQLPEGFDPRGGTLDVVVAPKSTAAAVGPNGGDAASSDGNVATLASQFGLGAREAMFVRDSLSDQTPMPNVLYNLFLSKVSENDIPKPCLFSEIEQAANTAMFEEEIEVLKAIYESSMSLTPNPSAGTTELVLPLLDDGSLKVSIVVENGRYPARHPARVLVSGSWTKQVGTALHVATLKYMLSTLSPGEPMIFDLHNQIQSYLADIDKLPTTSLVPVNALTADLPNIQKDHKSPPPPPLPEEAFNSDILPGRRPRPRGGFWGTMPANTPEATAFPTIPNSMKMARQALPAASARTSFLEMLTRSESTGCRVVLVEGKSFLEAGNVITVTRRITLTFTYPSPYCRRYWVWEDDAGSAVYSRRIPVGS